MFGALAVFPSEAMADHLLHIRFFFSWLLQASHSKHLVVMLLSFYKWKMADIIVIPPSITIEINYIYTAFLCIAIAALTKASCFLSRSCTSLWTRFLRRSECSGASKMSAWQLRIARSNSSTDDRPNSCREIKGKCGFIMLNPLSSGRCSCNIKCSNFQNHIKHRCFQHFLRNCP